MRLDWSAESLRQLVIIEHIAHDNLDAAIELVDHIFDTTENVLSHSPMAGRPGRVSNTRELIVHQAYLVVYRVDNNVISVVTIRHTARLWPESFD